MATSAGSVEVEAADVIKLIIQFLKENSLFDSLRTLQEESQVTLNTVDDIDKFCSDILHGRWDSVIDVVSTLRLPGHKLVDLYEQIVLELAEMREVDTAKALLRSTPAMAVMKNDAPGRYTRLEHILNRTYFDYSEAYPGGTNKQEMRKKIAKNLKEEVFTVPPSRLLALITQSLKWQQYIGHLPPGSKYDLFRGKAPLQKQEVDSVPKKNTKVIKFGKKSRAECAAFSPDGIWNFETGKLHKGLKYQAEDDIMMHEEAVLSVGWSRDSELLASGSLKGVVKIWRVRTGSCVRSFASAHSKGITSIDFAKDGTQILTASFDNNIRIHGLKSGRTLKEFRGHTSYVNQAMYSNDFLQVISGSSDGSVRIWDAKTTECLQTFKPEKEVSVLKVCCRSSRLRVMNLKGKKLQEYEIKSNAVQAAFSPKNKIMYAMGDDQVLYCFNCEDGSVQDAVRLHAKEVIGITHHPHRNILASFSTDGTMKIWRSGAKTKKVGPRFTDTTTAESK